MITLETRDTIDNVTWLSNVDVEYVSLVRHGANRVPFSIVKNESSSEDKTMSLERIHSVIVPHGKDVKALKEAFGEEWFSQVTLDNPATGKADISYLQRPDADFSDESAFRFVDSGTDGIQFKVGTLHEAVVKAEGTDTGLPLPTTKDVTVSVSPPMNMPSMPMAAMPMPMPDEPDDDEDEDEAQLNDFREDLLEKIEGLTSTIMGSLVLIDDQAGRKTIWDAAVKGFSAFLDDSHEELSSGTDDDAVEKEDLTIGGEGGGETVEGQGPPWKKRKDAGQQPCIFDDWNQDDEEWAAKAEWNTADKNNLPDSCFAVIETGYGDESDDKNARHLPYKDDSGNIDMPHLRAAMARLNQIKSVLGNDTAAELQAKAKKVLDAAWEKARGSDSEKGDGTLEYPTLFGAGKHEESDEMALFKTTEDLTGLIRATVKSSVMELFPDVKPPKENVEEEELEHDTKSEDSNDTEKETLKTEIERLQSQLNELTAKNESLAHRTRPRNSSGEDVAPPVKKSDDSESAWASIEI